MRSMLKVVLWSAVLLFIGFPALVLAFIFGMAALGIALGIGGAIVGLLLMVLKVALIVAALAWLARRIFAPEPVY